MHGGGLGYRIGRDGLALDAAPFDLPEGAVSCGQTERGEARCAALSERWPPQLTRFDTEGAVLGSSPLPTEGRAGLVGRLGERWLVVWRDDALRWVAVRDDGTVLESTRGAHPAAPGASAMGCSRRECLVVYRDVSSGVETLRGGFVRADGVAAWFGLGISDAMTGPADYAVSVTDGAFVVSQWRDGQLRAARVGFDRSLIDDAPIGGGATRSATPPAKARAV